MHSGSLRSFPGRSARRRSDACLFDRLEARRLLAGDPLAGSVGMEHVAYFPEGFAGGTIVEFVPIVNPNDQAAGYQLIARFETGERDLVVASGTIAAGSRGGVTISDYRNPDGNLVPEGRAYALELRSTLPLGAMLSHYDFGSATGESFTSEAHEAWIFAETVIGPDLHAFLVWQNTSEDAAAVTVTFYPETFENGLLTRQVSTEALRRGGLSLAELGLPDGRYGIVVNSSEPIVAALTQYNSFGGSAATELGFQQLGSTHSVLPLAGVRDGQGQIITVFNPFDPTVTPLAGSPLIDPTATVTLRFIPGDPSLDAVERVLTVGAGQRVSVDAAELRDQLGDGPYSVVLDADKPVGARASHAQGGDMADNAFSRYASNRWAFGEGFMDAARAGTDVFETISVYNTVDVATVQNEVTLTFRFADGFALTHTVSLAPGRHLHLNVHEFGPLLEQAAAGRNFYGVEVAAQHLVIAQMWHYDLTLASENPAGGFGSIGDPISDLFDLGLEFVPFPGV